MPRNNPEEANQKGVTSHEDLVFEHRRVHFKKLEPMNFWDLFMAISPFLHIAKYSQYSPAGSACRPHGSRSESEFHAPGSACGGNAEAGNSDDPACNKTLKLAGLSEESTCFHKDPLHHLTMLS